MPAISVIVPVYQAEKFIKKCVESVVKQTFSDWELLLIDDGCTDGSPAILDACAETTKGDPSFKYLDGILNGIRSRSDARTGDQVKQQLQQAMQPSPPQLKTSTRLSTMQRQHMPQPTRRSTTSSPQHKPRLTPLSRQ